MPVNDWEDSWYDDEPPSARRRRGHGAVVAVAVVTFIMCAFNAVCSSCLLFCGVLSAAFDDAMNGPFMPGKILNPTVVMLTIGLGSGVSFIVQIMAGVGLLNSRPWARTLSFYLAAYSALLAIFIGYLAASAVMNGAFQGESAGWVVMLVFALLFHAGYSTSTFWVLLDAKVARSFR